MILLYRHQLCFQTWFNNDFIWRISFVFIMPCLNSLWLPHLSMDLAGLSLGLYCCTMLVQSHTHSHILNDFPPYIPNMIYILLPEPVSTAQTAFWAPRESLSSVQSLRFVWLCHPVDCSMSGFPVHHQLLELTQTHVHAVGDAIQPSHPLLSPSPPAFNLSQNQSLFKWVRSLHQVAKVLALQLQHLSFQRTFRTDFL